MCLNGRFQFIKKISTKGYNTDNLFNEGDNYESY